MTRENPHCLLTAARRRDASSFFEHDFVDVAPKPVFARLDGLHNRMLGGVKMFGGMLVPGRIAATDVAANLAQAQVHPTVAHLETLFAAPQLWFQVTNLIRMGTGVGHRFSFGYS